MTKPKPTAADPDSQQAPKAPPKTSGRPKGAATKTDPVVSVRPPGCPRCHSTNRSRKTFLHAHLHTGGGQYHRTVFSRVDCRDCGQQYRLAETQSQARPFSQAKQTSRRNKQTGGQ